MEETEFYPETFSFIRIVSLVQIKGLSVWKARMCILYGCICILYVYIIPQIAIKLLTSTSSPQLNLSDKNFDC